METVLSFISKFTDVARNHIEEAKEIIGKEVVDSTASKVGICIDKVKIAFGAKFSLLAHNYSQEELKGLENVNEDVIVCEGAKGKFFVPISEIVAVGGSILLVRSSLGLPELDGNFERRKEEIFRKFFNMKESIKKLLPKVETPKPVKKRKNIITKLFY
jgi:sporulation protein YlmC with PRC-barrel domain